MTKSDQPDSRVILVLGGTGGIGSAICERLLSEGVVVVSASRSSEAPPSVSKPERFDRLFQIALDATDFNQAESAIRSIQSDYGRIAGLVNAVGSILLKPAHLTSQEEWDDVLQKNLTTAFSAVRSGAKAMRATGGSIVLIA